jgi:hypothetical protein
MPTDEDAIRHLVATWLDAARAGDDRPPRQHARASRVVTNETEGTR